MELRDYILKFPPHWQGIFAPLSKNDQPVINANAWLLESRECALITQFRKSSCHGNHNDWMGLVDGLCEIEPAVVGNQLIFSPRILLFPINIQRNTMAFLAQHSSKIPLKYLEKLLKSLNNRQLSDAWMALHVRSIRDCVCRKRCQSSKFLASDDHQSKFTKASRDTFHNTCQRIRDKDTDPQQNGQHTLKFDWLPAALASTNETTCEHRTDKRTSSPDDKIFEHDDKTENLPIKKQRTETNTSLEPVEISDSAPSSPMVVDMVAMETTLPRKPESREVGKVNDDIPGHQNGQPSTAVLEHGKENGQNDARPKDKQKEMEGHVIDAVAMEKLGHLKSFLSTVEGGPIPSEHLRILIDCPIDQMKEYCDFLELDSIPAAGLATLSNHLAEFSLELSHIGAVILARKCFSKQIQELTQTAPRTLLSAIVSFAKTFPKPTIEGALLPSLTNEGQVGVANHQCDLVAKVVKEALTNESRVHLVNNLLSVKTLQWSDEMTGLLQTIVACKLDLDSRMIETFVSAVEHHGNSQKSCAKFAKLLLAVINHFSKQFNSTSQASLQRLVDANQTFLKKALSAALKRIKA